MKKILILILTIIGFTFFLYGANINECKTDIYFGNGVWNTPEDAENSRKVLENFVIKKEIIKNDPMLAAKYGKVKLAYNWSADKNYDLVETFYQLRQAGQLSQWLFYQLLDALETRTLSDATGEDMKTMRDKLIEAIGSVEQSNVNVMLKKYYDESFQYSHRVLLVSHSQGNLFANRVYDSINPSDYQNYFANVQVASPANRVHASHGTYITGWVDPVINPIPGSMESNADLDGFGGHAFVAAYLDSTDTYTKIVNAIKAQLGVLDTIDSQWITDQEIERGTCDYCITVKHRFDPALEIGEKVYPFAPNKKLYQVNGTYVKATCGGTDFTDDWADKKENECWMINNPPEEKITKGCYITSFFDYDDEGWTIVGDAQNGNRNPDYKGGYIQATDDELGDLWYFQAPSKFSGDLSACYGSTFSFDLMQSSTNNQVSAEDIIINSTYGQITYRFGYTPRTNWTPFKKEMVETGWNRHLTEMEFKKILSSVTSIAIRGEYRNGFDIGSLDNVILGEHQ